jgi:hypothetical protein
LAAKGPNVITPCLDNGYGDWRKCETVAIGRIGETFLLWAVYELGFRAPTVDDFPAASSRHCVPQCGSRESGRGNEWMIDVGMAHLWLFFGRAR